MGRKAVIAINQSAQDHDFKTMINDLRNSKMADNPYRQRSESVIAKMLLEKVLQQEHKKYHRPEK